MIRVYRTSEHSEPGAHLAQYPSMQTPGFSTGFITDQSVLGFNRCISTLYVWYLVKKWRKKIIIIDFWPSYDS